MISSISTIISFIRVHSLPHLRITIYVQNLNHFDPEHFFCIHFVCMLARSIQGKPFVIIINFFFCFFNSNAKKEIELLR